MNPFADDVFSGSLSTEQTLPALYDRELNRLTRVVESLRARKGVLSQGQGSAALLLSPKAGAGKTHLLARLATERKAVAYFCPLTMHDPDEICWEAWFRQLVARLHTTKDPQGDHTALTGAIAYLLANATGALVSEGRIPCNSPATASQWLLENSVKLFDYSERENASVSWFRSEFSRLLPEIADRHARELDLDRGLLMSRLEWMFEYAMLSSTDRSFPERREAQKELLEGAEMLDIQGEGAARREWQWLGRMISQQRPLVLVIDDLDWAYRDEATALRLARMLAEFSRMVPNSLALMSVNEDTWRETFEKGLPEAVVDRLTSSLCRLKGVPRALWADLLSVRMNDSDESARLDRLHELLTEELPDEPVIMPRQLLRRAAVLWEESEEIMPETPAPRVFAKPQVTDIREEDRAESEEAAPKEGEAWTSAIGDLRSLIHARQNVPASAEDEERPVTPFIDVSGGEPRRMEPLAKPELTPEFRSFLSSLRARATDKEGYLPQAQPITAEERARERSQLILHGRDGATTPVEKKDEVKDVRDTSDEPKSPPVGKPSKDHKTRLRELKLRFAEVGGQLEIETPRLRRLVYQAGQLFPAIQQRVIGSESDSLAELCWSFQQSEVSFGFQSFDNVTYWKRMVRTVAERARELREKDRTRAKLAVFGRTREEDRFPGWAPDEQGTADLQTCDLILLTDHQLLSIYAVDELISEEVSAAEREHVFGQVSSELDFFWKMITRPVWTLMSPIKSTALSD